MKKIIFGVFAHPDDEAFGPSGTLILEAKSGTELHLITLTAGENGTNPDNHPDLGSIRLKEWQQAAKLIGASSTHFLGYKDGHLDNLDMVKIGRQIVELVQKTTGDQPNAVIEFMTSDLNGISGHIDHIVAARAACWAFYELKKHDKRLARIRLACIPFEASPRVNTAWLFMEPGRKDEQIDEIVDARSVQKQILKVMRTHHTQRSDGESHIARLGDNLGINYFIVKD